MANPDAKLQTTPTTRDLEPTPQGCHDELFVKTDSSILAPGPVKYEMLRRVQTDGKSVTDCAASFGFSRPSFYQALSAFEQDA